MALNRILLFVTITVLVDASGYSEASGNSGNEVDEGTDIFNGVYTECFLELSYTCLQRKTLLYLKELNKLNEISILGDYVKFVKLNTSDTDNDTTTTSSTEELAHMIDITVDRFFENHFIRFKALGKDVMVPETVEEFVGRKRRKGGGGGGGGHGGGGDGDGGKKKMMMMAMMCMKMKFMMMVPAMMGMMGMMSFKGMMFSMMSFMISKLMLLMKLMEKKGGGGGGGGGWNAGGGDGGWAAGGGGAWMPAGQDYGGGGGGGYDANGQWQSRSIIENTDADMKSNKPIISYVKPIIRYNNKINEPKPLVLIKNLKDEIIKIDQVKNQSRTKRSILHDENNSRTKRSIIDDLHRAYVYWANKVLGISYKKQPIFPKYKIVNGVKYVYHPIRQIHKLKSPKELTNNDIKQVNISEFNKGEIVEPAERGLIKKKFNKMKDNVNETVDDNPWE